MCKIVVSLPKIFEAMVDFIGAHDCTIDSKGRVIVPAPLKRQLLPFADKKFIVKRSASSPCLELYVMEEWDKLRTKLSKLNPFVKKNNDFKRALFAGIKEVELDSTGRILLAKDLLAYSGISKDVTMAAVGNIIEIWNKSLYEGTIATTGISFEALAEDVMGGIDFSQD
jgi:MraZ protein